MSTIRIFGRSPTLIGYGDPAYRGGPHFEDIIVGANADITSRSATALGLEDPFYGLSARLNGQFTYDNGEPTAYRIDKITFFYNGQKFQTWTGLDWSEADIEPVVDDFDAGDTGAVAAFLDSQPFRFVLDRRAEDPGYHVLTEGDDRFVAEKTANTLENGITIFSFGGDDVINLVGRDETVDVNTGRGDDTVKLGDGFSQVRSGSGNDVIKGGRGSDNIDGEGGKDRVEGGRGADVFLSGGGGDDTVRGGGGADSINDERGTNRLFGDDGDDAINGRGTLSGGRGDDFLTSTARRATDTFDFRLRGDSDFGRDTINGNWNDNFGAVDRIVFDTGTEISDRFNQTNGNLILTASQDGDVIGKVVLENVAIDQEQVQAILDSIVFL